MKSCDGHAGSERGAAELLVVAVLALCLLLTMAHASRVVVTGQRLAANDALAPAGLGAAQAGLEAALASLAGLEAEDVVFDGEGWTAFPGPSGALGDGASYATAIGNRGLDAAQLELLEIESTGRGPDGSGVRVVRQLAHRQAWLAHPPPAPLVARGGADLSGVVAVNRHGSIAAWLGGEVTATAAGIDVTGAPPCPPRGVCANDARLAALSPADLAENFLGRTPDLFTRLAPACVPCGGASPVLPVAWLEGGDAAPYGAIGSDDRPVLLVVRGDLRLIADVEFHGLLVVLGDWLGGAGELSLAGAMIVAGEISGAPAARLRYEPALLQPFAVTGPYARVAGSWSDF
jgi:hypothetical protein